MGAHRLTRPPASACEGPLSRPSFRWQIRLSGRDPTLDLDQIGDCYAVDVPPHQPGAVGVERHPVAGRLIGRAEPHPRLDIAAPEYRHTGRRRADGLRPQLDARAESTRVLGP